MDPDGTTYCDFFRVGRSSTEGHLPYHVFGTSSYSLDLHPYSPYFLYFGDVTLSFH